MRLESFIQWVRSCPPYPNSIVCDLEVGVLVRTSGALDRHEAGLDVDGDCSDNALSAIDFGNWRVLSSSSSANIVARRRAWRVGAMVALRWPECRKELGVFETYLPPESPEAPLNGCTSSCRLC